ncbi:MAG: permease [Tumebacillaceae bacterium]
MSQTSLSVAPRGASRKLSLWMTVLFLLIAAAGLYYVKWDPYYHKAITAATKHDIGASILGNAKNTMPAPSWATAWGYTVSYFNSVWKAAVLGIVLGSLLQVLIPQNWLVRVLGKRTFGSTAVAGLASLPGMMCTCCAAPVAVGLRKRFASVGAALAFWLGNPVLNPATILFMGFVLGWHFAVLRIVAGLVLVFGVSTLANRFVRSDDVIRPSSLEVPETAPVQGSMFVRWMTSLWSLFWSIVPAYVISVLVLGAIRTWLFPVMSPEVGNSLLTLLGLAIAGTLFVIPTAAEIPIVKTMMHFGLGIGPAAALMMTLPAVSLPSLLMVRKAFPAKVLWFVGGMVALIGIVSGFVAMLFL